MTAPRTCPHTPPLGVPAHTCDGKPLDMANAMRFLAACADGCQSCQRRYADDVLADPAEVVAHLAGMAFFAMTMMTEAVGARLGLGGDMVRHAVAGALTLSPPTRTVFSALELDDPAAAEALVRDMSRQDRYRVLSDAADSLTAATLSLQA